jgi:transcription initiation factor TFIIB
LYAACRLTKTPRSIKAIVKASTRSRKEISRQYRLIRRELDIKMPIDDPIKYVAKIASKTDLDQQIQNVAIHVLRMAKKKNVVVGKGPIGLAAAALYIAALKKGVVITQKELAGASKVTEVTIRNRYKGLDQSLGLGMRNRGKTA